MSPRGNLLRCMLLALLLLVANPLRAAITEVAATTAIGANGTTASLSIAVPAGTLANDVLLVQISASKASETITPPAGWTLIRSETATLLGAGMTQALYYRVATGTESASYSFGVSIPTWVAGSMINFRGVSTSSPIFGHSGQGGVLLLATAPAVASCPVGAMQVGLFGFNTGALGLTIGVGLFPYASTTTNPVLGVTIVNGGNVMGAAGTCPAVTTLAVSVTANVAQQVVLRPAVVPVTIDHFELNPPTTGITCQPQNITVKACMDTACTSLYSGSVSVTLGPASAWGSASSQTLSNGTGTYAFQPLIPGSYTLSVLSSNPTAVGATTCPTGGNGTCTIQIYNSGLVFNPPTYVLPNLVSGINSATITVAALGSDPASKQCIPALANVTRTVSFWSSYLNPASGTRALTLIANPNGAATTNTLLGISPGTPVLLTFNASGQAQIQLNYPDVGQVGLNTSYVGSVATADLGLSLTGSASFYTKPYTLALSNIKRTSDNSSPPSNPTGPSSALFARAGDALTMTVTAKNFAGQATPNFGKETPAQGVVLTSTLVAPAAGTNPAVLPASGSSQFGGYYLNSGFSGGAVTLTDLVWNEVGIMQLVPHVANASGLGYFTLGDLGSGDGSVQTPSANLGRFAPHHFAMGTPTLTNRADLSCSPASTFTYLDEPLSAQFQLTAQAAANQTTRNYDSTLGFAKLVSTTSLGLAAANIAGGSVQPLNSRLTVTAQTVNWSSGVANVSPTLKIARAANPDGPYLNSYIGTAPGDSDMTALASSALNIDTQSSGSANHASLGSTILRYGRLKLSNALGSDQLDLPVPAILESWNNGFTQNRDDNCTVVLPSGIGVASLGNYTGGLNAGNMGASHINFGTAPARAIQGKVALSLLRPAGTVKGSVDITIDLAANGFSYLKGILAAGNFNASLMPWARAAFGLYASRQPMIYLRENY
ncbi:hypothetical protein IGB42_02721 [Andreprevotia sp. IGB-42]|uniref:DUF6701 domain-containing protein n=1 Tax=Andreprevotia sp. IGB-42 TaxID=2497473 RepID=UPI00135C7F75|nr:DUF6701 domain-containing protein [Andreprevotia sp. IGB-42]KAF0812877.1 hypothetical protein IGB42_02721 [Andreprevotia sp. IGB-42]